MPDISMCPGNDCPLKEECYRHKATPSEYQSYFVEAPYDSFNKDCDFFWRIEKKNKTEE
jgi:hypothetical protein